MASRKPTLSVETFTTLLPRDRVQAHGERLQVFQRKPRKIDLYLLVWTLILALPETGKKTLDGLRVAYEAAAGVTLARASFYDRLNPQLAKLMKTLALEAIDAGALAYELPPGFLHGFRDLLALDATVLRLHDLLAKPFKATRSNHTRAAAKLQMVMSVLSMTPKKVKLSAETVGDTAPWKRLGPWVAGCLLLIDLGYYEFALFHRIDQNKGFFLSRAKSNFNGRIVSVNRAWRGRAIDVEGRKLQEVLPLLERGVLDVNVEVSFQKRRYRGESRRHTRTFRLVAVRNGETKKYHLYLTNLPPERVSGEEITTTYALRWQVEIFFKVLKSYMKLGDLPSSKKWVVEVLIWSSVLLSIVSGRLYGLVRRAVAGDRHLPLLRWGRVFSREARRLLERLACSSESRLQSLFDLLVHEAPDPNRARKKRALEPIPYLITA